MHFEAEVDDRPADGGDAIVRICPQCRRDVRQDVWHRWAIQDLRATARRGGRICFPTEDMVGERPAA